MNIAPGKTEFTDAEHDSIRQAVELIKTAEKLTEAEIARQAEVASGTLNSYLKRKYAGVNDNVGAPLWKWLQSRKRAAEMRAFFPVAPAFQPLRGSQAIMRRLGYAREAGRLVMIAGAPGVSKTSSARQYVHETPRAWLATMDPSTRGVPTMLLELLAAMGEPDARGTPQILARRVCTRALEAPGLIIIDDAQHLSDQAIEQLRGINDRIRIMGGCCGIALLGNDGIWVKVGQTGQKAQFAQVSSRVAMRQYWFNPDPKDAEAVALAWAAANREELGRAEIAFCQQIAAKPGGLRNIEMTMEAAIVAAHGADVPLTLELLQGAFAQLAGLERAA